MFNKNKIKYRVVGMMVMTPCEPFLKNKVGYRSVVSKNKIT